MGKPTGKIPLGRLKHKWENIRMGIKEIRANTRNWVYSAQDMAY